MDSKYKLSFDYYLEYAVFDERDCLDHKPVFTSRDVHEAFRELLAVSDGARRTLQLLLKDPEGKVLYYQVLAQVGSDLLGQ